MKFFMQAGLMLSGDEPQVNAGPSYIEVLLPGATLAYIIPLSGRRALVAACCTDGFDSILKHDQESFLKDISSAWPTMAELMRNTFNNNITEPCLLRFEDYDTQDMRWFIGQGVENVDFNSHNEQEKERLMMAVYRVCGDALGVFDEMRENKPRTLHRHIFNLKGMLRPFLESTVEDKVIERAKAYFGLSS